MARSGLNARYPARVFFFLSKLFDIFLSPYTWGLLFLAAAVPWRARSARRWRRRRAFGIAGVVVLWVASSNVVSNRLQWHLDHASASTIDPNVTYDAVVLLGGMVEEGASAAAGQASYNENVERLIATHRLLRDNRARVAIISGATIDPALAAWGEAATLGRQLEDWGIAKERIIIEGRARNTHENAVYTQLIAKERGFQQVLIVTSAFHMIRAAECFAGVGMKVDTLAVDYRAGDRAGAGLGGWLPRAQSLATTSAMTREMLGRWIYRVQGYGKAVP